MLGTHQKLSGLAISSLTTYLEDKARELMTSAPLTEINLSSEILSENTKFCKELKHFFHGKRLPAPMANEITENLLLKLRSMYTEYNVFEYKNYYQQIIGCYLVEIFLHPDVTEILLGRNGFQENEVPSFAYISRIILRNMVNLQKLEKLHLRYIHHDNQVVRSIYESCRFTNKELRSIAESCPGLKVLKLSYNDNVTESIPIILQLKHLETLHLFSKHLIRDDFSAPMNVISTDTTTDALSTSTIRSLGLVLKEDNTLRQIVEIWPHLTEIILVLGYGVHLANLVQLRNLRSLGLISRRESSQAYKYILAALGENLLSLYFWAYYLDLEFLGQTCTKLKRLYLHAEDMAYPQPPLKTLPNFKTVESLKVDIRFDTVWTEFIIDQCTNVKELYVALEDSLYSIIVRVIERTTIDRFQEIHWWRQETAANSDLIQDIFSKYPNIPLLVFGKLSLPETAVFYLTGSQHSFEEDFPHEM